MWRFPPLTPSLLQDAPRRPSRVSPCCPHVCPPPLLQPLLLLRLPLGPLLQHVPLLRFQLRLRLPHLLLIALQLLFVSWDAVLLGPLLACQRLLQLLPQPQFRPQLPRLLLFVRWGTAPLTRLLSRRHTLCFRLRP